MIIIIIIIQSLFKSPGAIEHVVFVGLVAYADLDERAIDALREFNEEGALTVLQQFKESDLSHVQVAINYG